MLHNNKINITEVQATLQMFNKSPRVNSRNFGGRKNSLFNESEVTSKSKKQRDRMNMIKLSKGPHNKEQLKALNDAKVKYKIEKKMSPYKRLHGSESLQKRAENSPELRYKDDGHQKDMVNINKRSISTVKQSKQFNTFCNYI